MKLALIPVIVVSGRDSPDTKELALKAGAKAFVQKPWDEKELLAIIRQLLGQPTRLYLDPRYERITTAFMGDFAHIVHMLNAKDN